MKTSIQDPETIRQIADDPRFISAELFKAPPSDHKFSVGETAMLTGLESYPEYNGQQVEITAIREDGPHGKAYYIKGAINALINWTYEYRLEHQRAVAAMRGSGGRSKPL